MHKFKLSAFILAITLSAHGEAIAGCVPCPDIASLNDGIKCGNGCSVQFGDWGGWTTTTEAKSGLQLTDDRPVRLKTANASNNPQCLYTTNQENVGFVAENPLLKDCKFPAPKTDGCGENQFSCPSKD